MTAVERRTGAEFAELVARRSGLVTCMRMGTISAFDPTTFTATVLIGGDTTAVTGVGVLAGSYFPAVNDVVWIAQTGTDVLVIGGHRTAVRAVQWLGGVSSTALTTTTAGAEIFDSNLYLQVPVVAGYRYQFDVAGRCDSSAVPTAWGIRLRASAIAASPSNPTTSSTHIGGTSGMNSTIGGGGQQSKYGTGFITAASTGNVIVGVSVVRLGGSGEVTLRPPESLGTSLVTLDAYRIGIP